MEGAEKASCLLSLVFCDLAVNASSYKARNIIPETSPIKIGHESSHGLRNAGVATSGSCMVLCQWGGDEGQALWQPNASLIQQQLVSDGELRMAIWVLLNILH